MCFFLIYLINVYFSEEEKKSKNRRFATKLKKFTDTTTCVPLPDSPFMLIIHQTYKSASDSSESTPTAPQATERLHVISNNWQ